MRTKTRIGKQEFYKKCSDAHKNIPDEVKYDRARRSAETTKNRTDSEKLDSYLKGKSSLDSRSEEEKELTKKKITDSGYSKSEEERLNINQKRSNSLKGGKAHQAIRVKCITTNEEFECIKYAYLAHKISKGHLRKVLKNNIPDKNGDLGKIL